MKKILLLCCIAVAGVACVDNDYDLSQIDSDFAIGGEGSLFEFPLARIEISLSKLGQDQNGRSANIRDIYEEADVWLPERTPDGLPYFDVPKLIDNTDGYLTATVDLLCDQMADDRDKRNEVAQLIGGKYADEFDAELPAGVSVEEFIRDYYDDDLFRKQIASAVGKLAQGYLSQIQIDPVSYDLPKLDVSNDVYDMLADNLDDPGVAHPKNALYIYGEVTSSFALDFLASPELERTAIAFEPFMVTSAAPTEIAAERIFGEDLDVLFFEGTIIRIPISVQHYYPRRGFDESQRIEIRLRMRKQGALTL